MCACVSMQICGFSSRRLQVVCNTPNISVRIYMPSVEWYHVVGKIKYMYIFEGWRVNVSKMYNVLPSWEQATTVSSRIKALNKIESTVIYALLLG